MQLAEAHARAAAAESRETAMLEALKEAKDWHVHQLGEAYLITGPIGGRWLLSGRIP